jgi:hypothetical protein
LLCEAAGDLAEDDPALELRIGAFAGAALAGTVRTFVVRHEALLVRMEVGDLRRSVVVATG